MSRISEAIYKALADPVTRAEIERIGADLPEQLAAMRGVKLCAWCQDRHFRPYPEQAASSCNVVQCQCWCTQGTGQ